MSARLIGFESTAYTPDPCTATMTERPRGTDMFRRREFVAIG